MEVIAILVFVVVIGLIIQQGGGAAARTSWGYDSWSSQVS